MSKNRLEIILIIYRICSVRSSCEKYYRRPVHILFYYKTKIIYINYGKLVVYEEIKTKLQKKICKWKGLTLIGIPVQCKPNGKRQCLPFNLQNPTAN